jgi:hypothetical protein
VLTTILLELERQSVAIMKKQEDQHIIKFAGREEKETKEYTVAEFTQVTGHLFVPDLRFENEKTLRNIKKKCMDAFRRGFVNAEKKWLGTLYFEKLRTHYIADVSIRWIDETFGYGLFTERDIKAAEYIGEYAGVVKRRYPFLGRKNDYRFVYPTSFFYIGKYVIDAKDKGNEIRYANHSSDPNCEAISIFSDDMFHVILRAIKDIPAHTQITYNYSDDYWKSRRRVPR